MQYNGGFTTNIYMKIFDMLVKPILTQNSKIWIFDWFKNINLSNINKLPFEKLTINFANIYLAFLKSIKLSGKARTRTTTDYIFYLETNCQIDFCM